MVCSELGEDGHHHAPDEVPALRIGQCALEQLEGGGGVAGVPRLEGGGELLVAGEPRASGETVGYEVARHAFQQVDRLLELAPLDQHPAELTAGGLVTRIDLERAAQGVLVTAG